MIINSAPQHEAVLSNVGQIGEFRIRNSAKAFNILSSGLYANKIRAVIRELSCNAVDSHIAAGKRTTAFDVHLPTSFEPWFAIRDYGTGLNHDQVTNIYTTYFESTKTDSNDYIGALGLGSKSPFSYTDNFTVTAIKDGKKGIYTAFINESGVPSIAQMMEEDSSDPSGVEVKFSVNDRYDFDKFYQEAREVYTYFALRPVVSADQGWTFTDVEYSIKDIIPGVHAYKISNNYSKASKAIMGNIAYPIDVPNATQNLGQLESLLRCGLEMHFDIGELDFQASREGLSYIPQTINSIKAKLELLNANLTAKLTTEADKISNLWERAVFLENKSNETLWSSSVIKYVVDTKFELMTYDPKNSSRAHYKTFKLSESDLATKFNISISGFNKNNYSTVMSNKSHETDHVRNANGSYTVVGTYWPITVGSEVHFVCNDTKVGSAARAKFHWRNDRNTSNSYKSIYVLSKVDTKKDADFAGFLKAIKNPPAAKVMNASALLEKPRATSNAAGTPVTLLQLDDRQGNNRNKYYDKVWRDAGALKDFDTHTNYYYMPIVRFTAVSQTASGTIEMKDLVEHMQKCNVPGLTKSTIYGVRKADLAEVQKLKNWINLEDHIVASLGKIDEKFWKGVLKSELDRYDFLRYNSSIVKHIKKKDSLFTTVYAHLGNVDRISYNEYALNYLMKTYNAGTVNPVATMKTKFANECGAVYNKYPLLKHLSSGADNIDAIAEYINLIDSKKASI